jgi:hypothetical protein
MEGLYVAAILGVAATFSLGLFSRVSKWPRTETLFATAMSLIVGFVCVVLETSFVKQSISAKGTWLILSPLLMAIAIPMAILAPILWIYILGRVCRCLWNLACSSR